MRISQEPNRGRDVPRFARKEKWEMSPRLFPNFPSSQAGLEWPSGPRLIILFSLRVVECLRGTPSSYSRNSYGDTGE